MYMEQLTIKIGDTSARVLRRAAKNNEKKFEDYIREILEWFALRETDPLFQWKPLKGSRKGVKNSAKNHNGMLYGKKRCNLLMKILLRFQMCEEAQSLEK